MSLGERQRWVVMNEVKRGRLSVVQAAKVMALSYRQAKRVWRRFRQQGDGGLVHQSRGQPSGRRKAPELRQRVLARYAEGYPDFGPTLAAEKLAAEGLVVDHETLRRWLLAREKRAWQRRRSGHRQWRQRKACFGELVQLDGSHHDWFEGRRPPCVLMVMVDDACNETQAQFAETEATRASYDVFEQWVLVYGVPAGLYVDRDSIYRAEGLPSPEEQWAGRQEPQTQFGRAMEALGVRLILAHSPQAKGRVERMNGVLQDRLVKELRLRGISDLETANRFLREVFLPEFNRRFRKVPASAADVHGAAPADLAEVLGWEQSRVVQRDWTVVWEGRWYQIQRGEARRALVGRRITVRRLRDGREQLLYKGQKLHWRRLPERPLRSPQPPSPPARVGPAGLNRPGPEHPWRRLGAGASRRHGRATRSGVRPPTGPRVATPRTAGQGSLRSGPRRLYPVGDRTPERSPSAKGDIFS